MGYGIWCGYDALHLFTNSATLFPYGIYDVVVGNCVAAPVASVILTRMVAPNPPLHWTAVAGFREFLCHHGELGRSNFPLARAFWAIQAMGFVTDTLFILRSKAGRKSART
jgi:hypothetical protein